MPKEVRGGSGNAPDKYHYRLLGKLNIKRVFVFVV